MDETTAPDAAAAATGPTPPDTAGTPPTGATGTPPMSATTPPMGASTPPVGSRPGYGTGYPPQPAPSGMDSFFSSVRRTGIVRTEERWIGGVSGGLALRMGIDPLIVRGLFAVSALLGGLGLVVYGVGWLLLPEQRDGRIHLQQLFRGDFDAAVIGGFALLLAGFAFPNRWLPYTTWGGSSSDWWPGMLGFGAIVVIIAVVASTASRNRHGPGPTPSLPRAGQPITPPYSPPYSPPHVPPHVPTYSPTYSPTYPAYSPSSNAATTPVPPEAAQRRPEGTTMYPAPPAPAPYGAPAHVPAGPLYGAPRPMPTPPIGPRTPLPPRPQTKVGGPGSRAVGIVVALSLLVLAGLMYAERVDAFDGPVVLTAAAVLVVLCGLGIATAGALGRNSGGLGAVAIVTILVGAPIAAATGFDWDATNTFIGDRAFVPEDVATAEHGYNVMVGNVTVDLTEFPTSGSAVAIPVHLGAGDLRVILPEDGAYTARVRVMTGELAWLDETVVEGVGGGWETFESPAVQDGADPDVELEITVGAGSLRVVEGSR